jgi:hypothetical protein
MLINAILVTGEEVPNRRKKKCGTRFTPLLISSSFGERLAICGRFPIAAIRFY